MSERLATRDLLIRGLPSGTDRDRTYLYSEAPAPLPVGSVVPYHQGSGDGRGADHLGTWLHYRHHGVVVASGHAEVYDAERDVWESVTWATYRPASMAEALGHEQPVETN